MQIKFSIFKLILLFLGLLNSFVVVANNYVVFDSGKARNLDVYIGSGESYQPKAPFTQKDVSAAINAQFPLETTLPLAKFSPFTIKQSLPYNIAVVGTDSLSKQWLQNNYSEIKRVNAVVLVISAKSLTEFTAFETILRRAGLSVGKVDGKMFLGILSAYPALIVGNEVRQ